MSAHAFAGAVTLLVVLLNPFLLSIYLVDLVAALEPGQFRRVLARAALISAVVFSLFAVAGDAVFTDVLQVRVAAFQLFGGIIFLIIGVRFVLAGPTVIRELRGDPEHVAGSIAMPFMIGPGTISASMVTGSRLSAPASVLAVLAALTITVLVVIALKELHDRVARRYADLVSRYIDVVGRISALVIGTIAVEMILQGIERWRAG